MVGVRADGMSALRRSPSRAYSRSCWIGVTVNLVVVKAIDERGERATDPKKASWTTPDMIAATFRFLASDGAAAITAARIPLHGRG